MKIAFIYDAVYPWLKGGGEKSLYELALELRHRGHEPHIFGMHLWDGPADMERDGLHYHAVSPAARLYGPGGRRRAAQPLSFAWGLWRQLPRYRLDTFDVIDIHAFPIASLIPWQRVRRRYAPRVPWLVTWLEVWGPSAWREHVGSLGLIGSRVERWAARQAPAHLCISPTTARRLVELLGVDPAMVHAIPRGFRPSDVPLGQLEREPMKVVIAGRLRSYKRVDVAIRAWPTVVQSLPDARLHVIGDGPEMESLRRLASAMNVTPSILFHGELPQRADVLRHLASSALLLQPSRREGQSTVALEALALGTPVLAARGPETAVADFLGDEAIVSQATIDVSAPPRAWAEQIVRVLSNPEVARPWIAAGRTVAEKLRWREDIAPRVESLYRQLAETARIR